MSRMACAWIVREAELRDQAGSGFDRVLRSANQRDDRVEMVERDPQPFEDVRARFGLAQLELDAPAHDLAPELDEVLDDLEQVQHPRPAAHDGQQRDAVAHLQLRVLVEVVQDDVRQLAALELDHDPHAVAVGLVAKVRDALELLVADQLGDLADQRRLVHLIRNLGDDDRDALALLVLLERRLAANHDVAAALPVGALDAAAADDRAAGREVGAGNGLQQRAEPLVARAPNGAR